MVKGMSNWYFYRNGQQYGPISANELKEAMEREEVDWDTLVWQKGMSEWVRVRKHPDLVSPISTLPPLPVTKQKTIHPLKQVGQLILDAVRGKHRK